MSLLLSLLSFSSRLLLQSAVATIIQLRKPWITVFLLLLPSLCLCTATQNPIILPNRANIPVNSQTEKSSVNIFGQNLNVPSASISSKPKNRNSIIRQNNHCPPNTIRCDGDYCIPEGWINDGEADCQDLTDERIELPKLFNGSTTKFSERTDLRNAEETFADPFDHFVTFSSIAQLPISVSPSLQSMEISNDTALAHSTHCNATMQARLNQCSTDLTDWIENYERIDWRYSSILYDETR